MQLSKFSNWLYFSKYSKFNSFFSKNQKNCYFSWFLTDLKQAWHIYINSRWFMPAESNAIVQIFELALFFKIFEIEFFFFKKIWKVAMSADFWRKWKRQDIFISILGILCPLNRMQLSKYSNSLYFSKYSKFHFLSQKNLKNCWNFEYFEK